jgi:hypothetical protein
VRFCAIGARDGQAGDDAAFLRHPADAALRDLVRRPARNVGAVEADRSGAGRRQPEDRAQRRRLAGAGCPEQRDDLAGGDVERNVEQRLRLAVVSADAVDLQHQATAPRLLRATHGSARSSAGDRVRCLAHWITRSIGDRNERHVVLDGDDRR